MRVLVISDTHGYHKNLDRVLELERPYQQVIHLGDLEGDEDYLEAAAGCPVEAVRGNNDYFSPLPQEQIIEIAGKRIFMTHGHYYYVALNEERLKEEARERGADIVMYGHTHKPALTREDDLITLNPGSVSYPRQQGRRPSYMIMELKSEGEVEIFQEWL